MYRDLIRFRGTFCPPTVLSPLPDALINETTTITLSRSLDPFEHSVTYAVYFSHDNASQWTWLDNTSETSLFWHTSDSARTDECFVRVIATCSSGLSAEDMTDGPFTLTNHTVLGLQITEPQGGEHYTSSPIGVSWTTAYDTWGHYIWYSVFFSADGGQNWTQIGSDTSGDYFDWNTMGFGGNYAYLVKVVARCTLGILSEDVCDGTFTVAGSVIQIYVIAASVIVVVAVILGVWILRKR